MSRLNIQDLITLESEYKATIIAELDGCWVNMEIRSQYAPNFSVNKWQIRGWAAAIRFARAWLNAEERAEIILGGPSGAPQEKALE